MIWDVEKVKERDAKLITICRQNPKKNNYWGRRKNIFMKHVHAWASFQKRSGLKMFSQPIDKDWNIPSQRRQRKAWAKDESKMALEWADRPYEADYSEVEMKETRICKKK